MLLLEIPAIIVESFQENDKTIFAVIDAGNVKSAMKKQNLLYLSIGLFGLSLVLPAIKGAEGGFFMPSQFYGYTLILICLRGLFFFPFGLIGWLACVLGIYANVVWFTRVVWLINYFPWDLSIKQKLILHSGTAIAVAAVWISVPSAFVGAYLWGGSFILLSAYCHIPDRITHLNENLV